MIIRMVRGIDLKKFLNFIFIFSLLNFNSSYAETKQRPWIGVEFRNVTEEFIKHNKLDNKTPKNIIITGVVKTSAADEAKIVPGDVVIAIDNSTIKITQDLVNILKTKYAGDIINVKVYRKGNILVKKVKLKKYPDPGFKPSWVKGSKLLKDPPKKSFGLENVLLVNNDMILYPKYFSKKTISKYDHDYLTVACIPRGIKSTFKLYDKILSIDGENPRSGFTLSSKPVQVKFKRNNKIYTKKITPTIWSYSDLSLRLDCTPEYADYDCAVDSSKALKLPRKDLSGNINNVKKLAYKKALECYSKNKVRAIPFHNIFKGVGNMKFADFNDYLYLNTMQYPEGHENEQKNLPEIKRILKIINQDLKEFEEFEKIYPSHHMKKSYEALVKRVNYAETYAGSMYTEDFKSSKSDSIKIDDNSVKRIKLILEKLIDEKGINNIETIKFLTGKQTFFLKTNQIDYLIEKYTQALNKINWKEDNLDKYFDDIFYDLSKFYVEKNNIDMAIRISEQGLTIAKENYQNLYFKAAYGEILMNYSVIHTLYKNQTLEGYSKLLKDHLLNLDKLSDEEKKQILKIDKSYYLGVLQQLHYHDVLDDREKDNYTHWSLKAINYIKENNKYNYDIAYPGILYSLLQGSIIDDDKLNFDYAKSELDILFANSANSKKKLRAILNYSGSILMSYDQISFYSEGDEFIKFIENTFDMSSQTSVGWENVYYLYAFYQGKSLIRNNKIEEAKILFEQIYEKSQVELALKKSQTTFIQSFVIRKYVPILFEIYFNEKNFRKINKLSNSFFLKNLDNLKKADLKSLSDYLSLDSIKVYRVFLNYFKETQNKKKFKMVKNHFNKKIDNILLHVKDSTHELTFVTVNSKIDILNEVVQIAEIFIQEGYEKDGLSILNKAYPLIIEDYNEKALKDLWKPNISDTIIGKTYLDLAENYLQKNKTFLKKAYSIAQKGKNLYTSRDVSNAISKKSFKDPEGLIEKYEVIKRKFAVNTRSQQFIPKEGSSISNISKELNKRNRELQKELASLEKNIKSKIPEYFKLTKSQDIKISEIQSLLANDEVLLDYYFYENDLKVVSVTKDNLQILSSKIDLKKLNKLNREIRNTLIPLDGKIKPYAVNKSFELNEKTFLFLDKITKDYKNVIVIPDGPLNSMPLHALAHAKNKDCLDCRKVQFNMKNHNFNYYPSIETFKNIDTVDKEFKKISLNISNKIIKKTIDGTIDVFKESTLTKQFKQLKSKILKKDKSKITKSKSNLNTDNFYLGVGDPDLYSKAQARKIDSVDKVTMLRSLFDKDKISSQSIKEIYGPVDGSADEINQVAEYLSPLKSKILLRENAKEINLKELDLSSYKIIHFATHGEVSGALTGINEPFLVLSPPNGPSTEDGLLTMSEIMSLNTNANLVVLSACNTAAGDETGSEGFSGLAKSFFMSGSKSILVSNWYVETYSAKEIVINLFKNLKDNPNFSISDGLNLTMSEMAKNEKERSHPLFWAPFVVVGKNQPLFF